MTSERVWVVGPPCEARSRRFEQVIERVGTSRAFVLRADCEQAFPVAFRPAGDLLRPLIPVVAAEAPDLLRELAPEVTALVPEVRSLPGLGDAPSITSIAVGGTRRRLHKDSEQLFRVVQAFASLVIGAASACPSLRDRPLVVAVDNLDAADRLSLAALFHLFQRADGTPLRLAAAAPRPRTGLRPWLWAGEHASLDPVVLALTDGYAVHASTLERVLTEVGAWPDEVSPGDGQQPIEELLDCLTGLSEEQRWGLQLLAIGGDAAAVRALMGAHVDPDALPKLRREARAALVATLPPPARQALHRQLAGEFRARPPDREATLFPLAYHLLRSGQVEEGVSEALRAADAGFAWSMNFDGILLSCREALAALDTLPEAQANDLAVPAWQLVALAQTYVDRHDLALEALRLADQRAASPEQRAQTCYYRGLVETKRLRDPESGRARFEAGLAHVGGMHSEEALLERGWLTNGLGLVAWLEGRHDDALAYVTAALGFMEEQRTVQALNLRVNLVNNLSVVNEELGRFDEALEAWRQLEVINDLIPSGTFSKSYFYRQGWLLMHLGRLGEALASCERAFRHAENVRDLFHMDLISRACGYLCCRSGRYDDALGWYRYNGELRARLGDGWGAARARAELAHVAAQAGRLEEAVEALVEASATARRGGHADIARQADAALSVLRPVLRSGGAFRLDPDDDLGGLRLTRPKAKLTTPFAVAHLSSPGSFRPQVHQSLLGHEPSKATPA